MYKKNIYLAYKTAELKKQYSFQTDLAIQT